MVIRSIYINQKIEIELIFINFYNISTFGCILEENLPLLGHRNWIVATDKHIRCNQILAF